MMFAAWMFDVLTVTKAVLCIDGSQNPVYTWCIISAQPRIQLFWSDHNIDAGRLHIVYREEYLFQTSVTVQPLSREKS